MAKKKVTYIYQSVVGDGEKFEQDVHIEAFTTKDKALAVLKKDVEDVKKDFYQYYDEEYLHIDEVVPDRIKISANYYADWWEGKVFEVEIQ